MLERRLTTPADPQVVLCLLAAAVSAVLGVVVLVGWAFDVPALRSLIQGAVEMKANTAIGLILAAAGVALTCMPKFTGRDHLRHAVAMGVALIGAATLAEYAFGWNLGIDEFIVRDAGAAFNQIKGRMSPYSAFSFCAMGIGLLTIGRPHLVLLSSLAGYLPLVIGLVSALGYMWNVVEIVTDRLAPPVAVNTACAFVLLGGAIAWLGSSPPSTVAGHARSRSRLETLILRGVLPTLLFVVVGGGLTYESGASFSNAAERVSHTLEVRAELGRLRAAVVDAETAQRNLLLTHRADFAQRFATKVSDIARHSTSLRVLVADNPAQLELHGRLSALIDKQLAELGAVGDVYRRLGNDAARSALTDYVQHGIVSDADLLIGEMDRAESALLNARLQQVEARRQATLLWLVATLLVLGGLFFMLFRSIEREMMARALAEERLQGLNVDLERRIAERTTELSHQQAFLRRVIDLDRNLIFAKDREGRFVLANQAMADLLGSTVDALRDRTERSFTPHRAELVAFESADLQVIEGRQELLVPEVLVTDARGAKRWLSIARRPILSPDGLSTIVLGVGVDITARIAAEDEIRSLNVDLEQRVAERTRDLNESNVLLLQARLDSEAATRAKSAFLANMSHEIRTPMNAIIGLTHLMLREVDNKVQRERLAKVGDAAKHLLQVINDILDMSKIEAGKMSLDEIEFSLDEVLSNAMTMVNSQAREKGLELIIDPDQIPDRVVGDPTRLSQILINLLSNAVKFTEYGWVLVRGRVVQQDERQVSLRFEVQDTGPGVALERQSALFSAFEQADKSTSRKHGGTGLGLALSRAMARAMGGDAGVISAPGNGSVFWFTVTLVLGAPLPERVAPVQTKGLRALLVDDLPEALSVIGDRLRLLGLEVDQLDSGPAALQKMEFEMAAGRPYDVMIIDWRMEPLDGIETLTRLRQLLGEGTPPALLVTAFDDATLAARAREAGFQSLILKPVTNSSLQDALARLLSRSHEVQAEPLVRTDGEALVRAKHAGQRVLLVEDNPVNREVGEQLLGSAGLIVETACDGAHAVEMVLSRHYDLVLMDVQMPVMDGLEATHEIRRRAGHRTPIIAMTANAFAEDRQTSLAAGMNDHLVKPVDPIALYATLLRWLPMRQAAVAHAGAPGADNLSEAELRKRLSEVREIDLGAALSHVGGHAPLLARVLLKFASTYTQGLQSLLDTAGGDDKCRVRWRTACHSVRGALSAIGATSLVVSAQTLERDLASTDDISELARRGAAFHQDLLTLVEQIETALD